MDKDQKKKSESAKNIRKSIISSSSNADVENEASKNIDTAKNLGEIAVSIETMSSEQERLFEEMIDTLGDIPTSIRKRERQDEELSKKLIQTIISLEKKLAVEENEENIKKLTKAIDELKAQGSKLSKPQDRSTKGTSILEGAGKRFLGLKDVDIENMRSRGGGVKGLLGAYKTGVKREFKTAFGIRDKEPSFEEKLETERLKVDASSQISQQSPSARKEKIRQNLESVADYNVAQVDPETGQYYRTSKKGERIESLTPSGKVNPQFDPAGLVVSGETGEAIQREELEDRANVSEDADKTTQEYLQQIAENTQETTEILNDNFGADVNENLDREKATIEAVNPPTATSSVDYDPETGEVKEEVSSGADPLAAIAGAIAGLATKFAGPVIKALTSGFGRIFSGVANLGKNLLSGIKGFLGIGGKVGQEVLEEGGEAALKKGAQVVGREAAETGAKKGLLKVGGKTLLKKIPLVGAVAGVGFGIHRAMQGDFAGALGEVASGAASTIPGIGTGASLAIDAGLAARDIKNAISAEDVEGSEIGTMDDSIAQAESIEAMSDISEAVDEQRRMNSANQLEQQAVTASDGTPVVNNIDNSQRVVNNNYAGEQSSGKSASISVRNDSSSFMRFQERRFARVLQ